MPGPATPSPPAGPHGTFTLGDVAEQLGVHYMTVYRYVRTGLLAAEQHGGQWQVTPAALDEFRSEREQLARRPGRRPKSAPQPAAAATRQAVALAACLIGGDQAGAWRVVEAALVAGARPVDVYHAMLAPALRIVGDRWAAGQITVADEHRATVVAMRLIGRLGVMCARPGRTRGSVVLAAAPGDRHGLPTAMLADLLRAEGFHVTDLGADTPPADVAAAAQAEDRVVGVGVCATSRLTAAGQRKLAQAVRAVHDRVGCPVLVGGAAVTSAQLAHRLGADGWSEHATDAIAWFASLAPVRS